MHSQCRTLATSVIWETRMIRQSLTRKHDNCSGQYLTVMLIITVIILRLYYNLHSNKGLGYCTYKGLGYCTYKALGYCTYKGLWYCTFKALGYCTYKGLGYCTYKGLLYLTYKGLGPDMG